MRACFQWLAVAPLLVLAGCSSVPGPTSRPDAGIPLPGEDAVLAEALAHYSQALISDSTLGESQTALAHYRKAAESDRANLPLNLKVAYDYLARKDSTNAVSVLQQTARFHPRSVEVQLLLGSAYQAMGKDGARAAVKAFRRAISVAPDRPEGYVRLASLYVMRLQPGKALKVVDEGMAVLKDPSPLLEFCATVGRIYLAGKDVAGAARLLEKVCQSGAGPEESCELLGKCHVLLGRHREAAAVFEALLKRYPGNSHYALMLGEVQEQQHETARAMESYRQALKGLPPDPLAVLRLANLEMTQEEGKGIQTLEQGVKAFPDDFRLHVFLALSYISAMRPGDAVREFERASGLLDRDPATAKMIQPLFYFWFGQACDQAGRMEEAERYISRYLEANPQSGEALNYLAYLWAEEGRNLDEALSYVTLALKQEPGNGAYLDTLGWIYFKKGDYAAAVDPITRALKLEGESATILDHLGDTWWALHEPRKAVSFWLRSLRQDPSGKGVREKLIRAGMDPAGLPDAQQDAGTRPSSHRPR